MFDPLEKKRYSEKITDLIQQRILTQNMKTGAKLPGERQLASELGVSRSVVREALRMLYAGGYVSIKKGPRGGIFVSQVYHKPVSDSLKSLTTSGHITTDHLFDVRLQIEPFIVEQAILHHREADIKRLSALFVDAAAHADDTAYLKQKNIEFHLLLAEASGNPVLSILMKSITEILIEIAYNFLDPALEKEFVRGHTRIFETIIERKVRLAKKLLKEDILLVKQNLKLSLENRAKKVVVMPTTSASSRAS